MATAQALIDTAYTELRVKSPDTDMDDQEYADGLSRLNAMMASRAADIAGVGVSTVGVGTVSGAYPMSVGPSGDVDMVRPVTMMAVSWGQFLERSWTLELVSWEKFQEFRLRRFSDPNTPVAAYYRPTPTQGELYLMPAPKYGVVQVQATTPRYQWAALDTDVDLPPGLQLAVELELAVQLAGQFQISAGQELAARATAAWQAWAATAEAA